MQGEHVQSVFKKRVLGIRRGKIMTAWRNMLMGILTFVDPLFTIQ
jgi:hypothetical protein